MSPKAQKLLHFCAPDPALHAGEDTMEAEYLRLLAVVLTLVKIKEKKKKSFSCRKIGKK